jgi:hypothetical protein
MALTSIQVVQFYRTYDLYKDCLTRVKFPGFANLNEIFLHCEQNYQSLKLQGKALQAQCSDTSSKEYQMFSQTLAECKELHKAQKRDAERLFSSILHSVTQSNGPE